MSEENNQEKVKLAMGNRITNIELSIKDFECYSEKKEEIFEILDDLDRVNSIFKLREKYSDIFLLLPNEVLIFYNESNWSIWEKVLLILFSSLNFSSSRSRIWEFNISQSTLRGIISKRTDYIESIDDDIIKLTSEGLKYIINKLNVELSKQFNNNIEVINNE